MAYDPQQQRPEQQVTNSNRQALNIQQPGEPSDFDRQFFSAENWNKPVVEPKATLGDYGKSIAAAPFEFVQGIAQLPVGSAHAAKDYAKNDKNISRLSLFDQLYVKRVLSEATKGSDLVFGPIENIAGSFADSIKDSMTEGGKQAAAQEFVKTEHDNNGDITGFSAGEGLFNIDSWVMNAAPSLAQMFSAAGAAKIGTKGIQRMIEEGTFNRLSKTMTEDAAREAARKTGEAAKARAQKYGFIAGMSGSAQGQGGIDMREQVNNLSFNELVGSSTFQSAFSEIDANPDNSSLSDTQKLELARAQVAEQTANAVTTDPRLLAVNIAASTLGDHTLLSLLTKKTAANGILSGAAKGAVFEGTTEFAQGSGQRYAQNEQLIDTAGQNIDPMQNVLEVGANNAVLGVGMGSSIGAAGGMRGRNSHSASEANQNTDTSPTAEQSTPVQSQLSPYDEATQRYAAMDRAAVLREYANADLSNNADAKRAANERLAGIDREDSVSQFAEKYQQQSDDELLVTYRDLNEKAKRSDEEQMQYEAARTVLSQRLGVTQPQVGGTETHVNGAEQQTAESNGSSISVTQSADNPQLNSDNVAGTPQSHIDEFRDTPAYLRQDPRIQGFAEYSDVQQALAEQQDSPTAEQLIRQQIEQGDQGYSPQELEALEQAERIIAARRPRLPAPGQTSVIAMPGEVRQPAGDDSQAGTGPQFDSGQQVRGQEFIPAERSPAMNEVGRAHQTYDGEAVPTNAIEDKNIIFSGSPTIDEGQTAQPPQFTEGESRSQRQTREFSDAMGVNDQETLPDQRQRVAGVPVDAQTEAYARGEPVGELKFYQRDRPFSNEHVAKHSKWGKMPGATVEEVDGGYAVRLPSERVKDTITLPSGEVLTVTMDPDVPGSAILTTEDGGRIGLSATQVDGIKSELAGDRPVSGGIGDLARLNAALERIRTHTEHRGYPLFPVDAMRRDTGEKIKAWAIQTQPNSPIKIAPKLFDTREEAISYADRLADRDESNAASRSKRDSERKEKDSAEAVKRVLIDEFLDAQTFSPMQRGKADKTLQEMVHYSEFDRPMTRSEVVQRMVDRGWHPENAQKTSENGKAKTSYRIVSDDGDLYNVTKTEHDFAAHLIARRSSKKNTGMLYSRTKSSGLQTESTAFKLWFGDSKVTDSDGRPLVVYHGTGSDFEQFMNTHRGAGGESAKRGFFFTASPEVASSYAEETPEFQRNRDYERAQRLMDSGKYEEAEALERSLEFDDYTGGMAPNVMPTYLSIQNPAVVDFGGRAYDSNRDNLSSIIDKARQEGRDGVIFRNIDDAPGVGIKYADHYVVFRPEQIKSAIGNRGTFEPDAPSILHSRSQNRSPQNASKSGGVSVSGADIGGGNIIHDGSFSRDGSKPETGMLRDRVQLAADGFVSHLNGAAKIKVKAVQTQAEAAALMPNGIPEEFGTVHAIYQPELSRVIVIADNIANARELRAKLRHEVIAHHGLASVIGDVEYDRIMRVLHQTRDSQNKTIQDVWRQVEQSYGQESLETQANEFLAHMAERTELTKLGGVWDRFVTLLTNALRKAGVLNPMDITPAEIRNILRTITGRFQKTAMYANEQPGTREFDNTFSRTDALYSQCNDSVDPLKPLPQEAERYRADLDRAMRSLKSADVPVKLGRTPPVLRALDAPNLDMVITRDTVRKATNGVKHDAPLDVIARLPELMHDPLAIYRSATQNDAVVMLLEAQDMNKNPVVSAVHMSAKSGFIEVNRIASVYGTVGGMSKVQGMEDAGLALYRREKQNPEWLRSRGLQLPKENTVQGSKPESGTTQGLQLPQRGSPDQGSGQNILSSADIRKNKTLYSRSANPAMDAETSRKMGFNVEKGWFDKAKDFYQMASDSDRADLKQWWQETFRKLNTKTFDGLAPLKYAEDAAGKSDAMVSGYTAARMSAGSGSVTAAVLEHGLVRYNKNEGITERIPGTGKADSLMGILDGLGNHRENFLKWIAGHRSERLMAEGKENNFTADEIAYMKSLNRGNENLFADQKVKYDAFIKSIIDLQQDMGLIDPESRATWEDAWYLPYYREAENGETHGPWTTRGIANQSSTIRKLKGSDLTIKDPIENLFNYVAKSVDASMKNEAMRRSIVNLGDTGVIDIIENPNQIDYQRLNLKKDTVKVFVDGKEQLARINDPDLYRAFTMIDLERSKSLFMRAARQAKRVLTIGTTSMPDFIIRNFIRDSVHSWAINKDGFKAIRSSWDGLNKAMRTDSTLVDMMFAGATFGGGYSNVYDPGGTASNIRKVLRRKGYKDSQIREFESSIVRNSKEAMDKMGVALEKYRKVSEGAENANRVATYDAALKAGKSKAQAAFESRDLMDFSMQGSSSLVIGLSDMVPFFNARLQGMSKLGRAIKDDPREVLKRGGYIAGLSLALLAMNWGDERYEELQDWDKDAYWHAWFGDQHIRIPKPFEIGLMFGTLPERFARALGGEDTPGKFGKVMAHNFFETMAFNPIPQVTRPIIETFVNYDFFKGGPIEGMADKNVIAGARFNDQTSLLMREIGESTNLSPKMLDHIITGYTGTLGSYILGATNIIMRNLGDNGESASLRVDELPVIKAIFRGSDPAKSTQFTEDFYQMMTKVNQINSTINDYRKQGRHDDANELLQDNREKLSQRKAFTATQKQVKQLNDQIELIRIDRILTADQKRERIDRLMAKRNMLVQQTVKRVHPYFDK
ncbi:LPD38 domain-containing protein [Pectobacterium fontis]|uniref:LPD38 domain-containing protein n=1 Tax=Pectobacterium fontis TaxID=2558042 RepID=UPI000690498D|nr:LPD38 domain-containing protein [Pectobacterium fontis]